jgi:acyl-CoA hydrolase
VRRHRWGVAAYAANGGTVQMGIGQILDAAATALRDMRGLGVWSDMVSDGVLDLVRAKALDVNTGPIQQRAPVENGSAVVRSYLVA